METIDTEILTAMRERNNHLAVVSVLPHERYYYRHIPGSSNVPLDDGDFTEKVARVAGGRDEPVVVYCASNDSDASERAATLLDEAGFREVYDYAGGMRAWQDDRQPIQVGARPGRPR